MADKDTDNQPSKPITLVDTPSPDTIPLTDRPIIRKPLKPSNPDTAEKNA